MVCLVGKLQPMENKIISTKICLFCPPYTLCSSSLAETVRSLIHIDVVIVIIEYL